MHNTRHAQKGFTIVELLIVIVVIGILAAITAVAYNGIQAKASDARLRSVASQLEKAILIWTTDTNLAPKSGWSSAYDYDGVSCGGSGTGGWVNKGAYRCSLEDILVGAKLIPPDLTINAPKNNDYGTRTDGGYSYMIYPCTTPGQYALYYYLNKPSAEDTANLAAVEASGCPTGPRTTYKMRAAKALSVNGL